MGPEVVEVRFGIFYDRHVRRLRQRRDRPLRHALRPAAWAPVPTAVPIGRPLTFLACAPISPL
ncbi:hypothetical protein GCM10023191_014100 [Actinoallomurus oryzae]|uniref:Uncharacterized protein n=1 Tax=Actinoallomurus oryzae TaxID=502180 RepID=A0ABP8PJ84_9ACTN